VTWACGVLDYVRPSSIPTRSSPELASSVSTSGYEPGDYEFDIGGEPVTMADPGTIKTVLSLIKRTYSLRRTGNTCHPLPAIIPIERFESLETLKLVGRVGRLLLYILQPNNNLVSGVLLVPFLSRLELHPALPERDLPYEVLTEILRKRKVAGHGVETVRIAGECRQCSSGPAIPSARSSFLLPLAIQYEGERSTAM